jgi:starch-binding outer membrane protein, SusD/RagB family
MKHNNFLTILAISVAAVSCSDFLNLSDPNSVTTANYYTSVSDIQNSVNGVYAVLKESNFLGSNACYFEDNKARFLTYPDTGVGGGENAQFDNCTVQASNQMVLSRWNAIYKCIDRANVVLKHIDDIEYSSQDVRSQIEAEVRFVRALCYYTLVCDWGPVPVVLQKLETLAEVNEANVRQPKDVVYQAIFDDCEFVVSSKLPDLQSEDNCGRASKVAAEALWAKAALQMATDEDFSSRKSELCNAAITQLTAAWSKAPFADFTKLSLTEIWDVDRQAKAAEGIFQLAFIGGSNSANSSYNTQFRPTDIYDSSKEVNAKATSGGHFMPYNTTLKLYSEAGDLRMSELLALGSHKGNETYYTLKYRDLDASGYYGCNNVVLRYADVALMLAEAYYHSGNAANAQKYLNLVRNRAGLASVTPSGTALRDAIYKERQREFAYEFKAYSDMKRGYTKAEMSSLMKADGATEYSDADYYLPIPHTQHILNPEGLYQNPGY